MINKELTVKDNQVVVSIKTKKSGLVTGRVVNGKHGYDIVELKAERDITPDRLESIRDSLRQWYLSQYAGQHNHML